MSMESGQRIAVNVIIKRSPLAAGPHHVTTEAIKFLTRSCKELEAKKKKFFSSCK
jgi:hypothetical protein